MLEIVEDNIVSKHDYRQRMETKIIPFLKENLKNREEVAIRESSLRETLGKSEDKVKQNSFYAALKKEFNNRDITLTIGKHKGDGERLFIFSYRNKK